MYVGAVAGSTQGIGLGILRSLAGAGADVVMHGLAKPDVLQERTSQVAKDFGVTCGHSDADVTKPQAVRSATFASFSQALANPWHRQALTPLPPGAGT